VVEELALTVIGVDICGGTSPSAKGGARYAAVYLVDNEIKETYEEITLASLLRIIWKYQPSIVAIDNVFELTRSSKALIRLLSAFPPGTRLVQITGAPTQEYEPLVKIAEKHGIKFMSKPTSLQTASTVALLASKGVGWIVKGLEDECMITVSKKLTPQAGGMSMQRYERLVRSSILRLTKEIKEILRMHGFDYDLIYRKGEGGINGSVFIVYAPREKLSGIVKPYEGHSVRVTIKPVIKRELDFEPLSAHNMIVFTSRKGLIIGYDPGITAGLSVITLDGDLLLLKSGKYLTRGEIAREVLKLGVPVIVASDRKPATEMVKKLASMFGAILYEPEKDLKVDEKKEIVNKFLISQENVSKFDTHMRDALAASVKAYMHYKPKLQQLEEEARLRGFKGPLDKAKIMVIQGVKISEALQRLEKEFSPEEQTQVVEVSQKDKDLIALREKVKELIEQQSKFSSMIAELQMLLEKKNREVEELRNRLQEERLKIDLVIRKDRKVEMLNEHVKMLESTIKKLELDLSEFKEKISNYENIASRIESGELTVVKKIENAMISSVKRSIEQKRLKCGEVIYLENPMIFDEEGLNEIIKLEPKIIILTVKPADWLLNFFRSQALPVYLIDENKASDVKLVSIGSTLFIEKEKISKIAEEEKEKLKRERLQQMRENLEKLIEEYRKRVNTN
jgi:predicted RNase H-like nuclease (RuvC/YqgF family)